MNTLNKVLAGLEIDPTRLGLSEPRPPSGYQRPSMASSNPPSYYQGHAAYAPTLSNPQNAFGPPPSPASIPYGQAPYSTYSSTGPSLHTVYAPSGPPPNNTYVSTGPLHHSLYPSAPPPFVLPQVNHNPASPFVRGYSSDLGINQALVLHFIDRINVALIPTSAAAVVHEVAGVAEAASGFIPGAGEVVEVAAGVTDGAVGFGADARSKSAVKRILNQANATMFRPAGLEASIMATKELYKLLGYKGPGSKAYKKFLKADAKAARSEAKHIKKVWSAADEHDRAADKAQERGWEAELRHLPREQRKVRERQIKEERRARDEYRRRAKKEAKAQRKQHMAALKTRYASDSDDSIEKEIGDALYGESFWDDIFGSSSDEDEGSFAPLPTGLDRLRTFGPLIAPVERVHEPLQNTGSQHAIAKWAAATRDKETIAAERNAAKRLAKGKRRAFDRLNEAAFWLVVKRL